MHSARSLFCRDATGMSAADSSCAAAYRARHREVAGLRHFPIPVAIQRARSSLVVRIVARQCVCIVKSWSELNSVSPAGPPRDIGRVT